MPVTERSARLIFGILLAVFVTSQDSLLSQNGMSGRADTKGDISKEEWISIGPIGIPLPNNDVTSGQVTAIAVDPRDANTIYVGAAEGGVWKTTDGGGTWKPLTDLKLVRDIPIASPDVFELKGTTGIGAIAIDPAKPDTVYVGTGQKNGGTHLLPPQLGVFRSTDGGENWVPLGINTLRPTCPQNGMMNQVSVNRLIVRPGEPSVIYAATRNGFYYYREDETDCWMKSPGNIPAGDVIDMAVDTYRGTSYIAIWGVGVFRSADPTQQAWTQLTNGLPTTGFTRVLVTFAGRTIFGPPGPILYAGFMGEGAYRLFKTDDSGDHWTELPSVPSDDSPGTLSFAAALAVGNFSSDDVFLGQVGLWRSLDGGSQGGLNDFKTDPPDPPNADNSWTNLSCCLAYPTPSDPKIPPPRTGMDLHADTHDIVFAPVGSYTITPSTIQIVYVANDGGISKGVIDSRGTVTWQPLTQGLAISQVNRISIDPRDPSVTISGLWHNGTVRTVSGQYTPTHVGPGDGFYTGIDPGVTPTGGRALYVNYNKPWGGMIYRMKFNQTSSTTVSEIIWSDKKTEEFWSDPYRSGHLLRSTTDGLLFRTELGLTGAAAQLDSPNAWEALEPPGKKGKTISVAFRSALLESQPVYYIGTTEGQIWRGSPEKWTKICDCGQAVNAIAPDLVKNERIFAVLDGQKSPGRIKELTLKPDGTWSNRDIDTTFTPQLAVLKVMSVVVDPLVVDSVGTTIYVGTDQGVYRGDLREFVVGGRATKVADGSAISWSWSRSPGIPNIAVPDLEVHQGLQEVHEGFRFGVIRAGTNGRGVFELVRASGERISSPQRLKVEASEINTDGASPSLDVEIRVIADGRQSTRLAGFDLLATQTSEVSLEAPTEIQIANRTLRFVGWVVGGKRRGVGTKISVTLGDVARAVAFYEAKTKTKGQMEIK